MTTKTTNDISALTTRVQKLPGMIEVIHTEIQAVEERMRELKALGLVYASPHWRAQKYFTLIYPQKDGVRPSPKYVGTDEAKIEEAMKGIERAKEYDKLQRIATHQAHTLDEAMRALQAFERVLTQR